MQLGGEEIRAYRGEGQEAKGPMESGEKSLLEQLQNLYNQFPPLIPPALQPPDLREWPEDKSPQQEVLFSGS